MMNRQSFDFASENGRKHFQKLLDALLDYNNDSTNNDFNDIHIKQCDFNYVVLEWEKISYPKDCISGFCFLEEGEYIYKEVYFPDGHYEEVPKGQEEEVLKTWHQEHPEWVLTSYGTWTNTKENEAWQKLLEKERKK